MTLNAYLNRFRSVKRSNRAMSWNAWDISTALFPVLHSIRGRAPLENPWKWHFRDSKFPFEVFKNTERIIYEIFIKEEDFTSPLVFEAKVAVWNREKRYQIRWAWWYWEVKMLFCRLKMAQIWNRQPLFSITCTDYAINHRTPNDSIRECCHLLR